MAKGYKTGGRSKGTPNAVTKEIRSVYKELLEKNLSNIDIWLQEVAKKNPDKALNFVIRLSEYVIPKLQSTQLTGNLDKLTDEQLDTIIQTLNTKKNE